MLMISRILVLVLAGLLLTGCSLRLPGVAIDIGDVDDGPHHCPPGQAKKGNC
jgi:hypothetical protein